MPWCQETGPLKLGKLARLEKMTLRRICESAAGFADGRADAVFAGTKPPASKKGRAACIDGSAAEHPRCFGAHWQTSLYALSMGEVQSISAAEAIQGKADWLGSVGYRAVDGWSIGR